MGVNAVTAAPPLRGRDAELARMSGLLDDVCAGTAARLLVEGAAGAGKTALLDAAGGRARARHLVVAAAQGGTAAPFGTLLEALAATGTPGCDAAWADRLARRDRRAAATEIRSAVDRIARDRPLVVVIDDAGDADEASLRAARELIGDPALPAVCWLFAARPGGSPAYRRLRADRHAGDPGLLSLRGLGPDARAEIARDLLGAPPDADLIALLGTAGDVVAGVVDLLDGALRAGACTTVDGRARLTARAGSAFVTERLTPLLAALSPAARRLVDVAAVLGPSFAMADLSALMQTSASRIAAEVRELCGAGLVVDGRDGEPAFAHETIRAAVLDRLPSAVQRAIHRDMALHLVAIGAPAQRVAPYVVAGRGPVDPLDEAAPVLPAGAHVRALELAVPGSRRWLELVPAAARALAYGGRPAEAEAVLGMALDHDPPAPDRAAIRFAEAETRWLRGRNDGWPRGSAGSPRATTDALRGGDAGRPPRSVGASGPAAVVTAADAGALPGSAGHDDREQCFARLAESETALRLGRMDEAVAYARQSVSFARRAGGGSTVDPRIWLARALSAVDRLDEAQDRCEDLLREIPARGNVAMLPGAHAVRARVLLARGRLVDAAAEAEAGVVAAEASGAGQALPELLATLAFVAAVRGGEEVARQAVHRCSDLVSGGGAGGAHLALAHATAGADPAAVLPGCRALADGLGTGVGPLIADPGAAPLIARVLLAAGDPRRAETVLAAAARLATMNPRVPGWSAGRLHVTGLTTGATAAMRAAARHFTEAGRHFAAAVALADAALLGLGRGEPEARRWLDEAGRALRAMGATAVLADLLRRGPGEAATPRPDRTAFGWNSLTGAELRVVLLAATGASNKEIARQLWLSPHTVGTHVRHALGKLGLRSRVEMARQAGERGITAAAGADREPVLAYET